MNTVAAALPNALIADDQTDVLTALRLLLKGAGYQTEAVTSPTAVLNAIQERDFDVVLMDLNYARDTTSGREGLDLVSRIQALDHTLPVVVMTAWGTVELAVEAMRRGVRDFVQKPWDNSRLLETLSAHIEPARTRRQRQSHIMGSQLIDSRLPWELEEAREIQQGLMPNLMPLIGGIELAGHWQAALTVSGDYLAAFKIDQHKVALCIADVSGKGLPAALLTSNLQAALKSAALEDIGPREVCARVNHVMHGNIPLNRFISCFYGELNTRTRQLVFTNAGHNPALLVRRDGECTRLVEGGPVLGAFSDSRYTQSMAQLYSGDRLVLFTDGLTEATNSLGQEFGETRLLNLIATQRDRSAVELQAIVMDTVNNFCFRDFHDDAALMIGAVQ